MWAHFTALLKIIFFPLTFTWEWLIDEVSKRTVQLIKQTELIQDLNQDSISQLEEDLRQHTVKSVQRQNEELKQYMRNHLAPERGLMHSTRQRLDEIESALSENNAGMSQIRTASSQMNADKSRNTAAVSQINNNIAQNNAAISENNAMIAHNNAMILKLIQQMGPLRQRIEHVERVLGTGKFTQLLVIEKIQNSMTTKDR